MDGTHALFCNPEWAESAKATAIPGPAGSVWFAGSQHAIKTCISIPGVSYSPVFPDGEIFVSNPAGPGLWDFSEIQLAGNAGDIGHYLLGFGQDLEGEIYVTGKLEGGPTGTTGKVFKLVRADKEKESL